ncbi:methionine synthase [Microlunatus speluncae]|uniref:methionine synthase n=1 Tax=Microlunatus speluncae TaxID=2594267 RepID=UPI0012663F23|nr:methionine synthase [Microlunatus speluncae]
MTFEQPVISTGIGSWPGTDIVEAIKITFDECPDLPYLPELPARGAPAGLIGRSSGILAELTVDLQPSGWRLIDGYGIDHRRAVGLFRDDLDQLEEQAQGYAGWFKIGFAGPWTLAASIERQRGGLVLSDTGARRDLGQSLAEGLAELSSELNRRLPDLRLIIQLDEPLLPAVHRGSVPTASGYGRYRAIDDPELSETLTQLVRRLEPHPVVLHCCAAGAPIPLLAGTGITGIGLDLDQLRTADWDGIGAAIEQGIWFGAGAAPTDRVIGPDAVAERVLRPVRDLGLDPESSRLVITPACGLAGSTPTDAVRILHSVRRAAEIVAEELPR